MLRYFTIRDIHFDKETPVLTNASQVIERNIDSLARGARCVLVGAPADDMLHLLDEAIGFTFDYCAYRYMQSKGYRCMPFGAQFVDDTLFERAVIYVPKSRDEFRLMLKMLAPAMVAGGEVFLVGEKKEGIATAAKVLEDYCDAVEKLDMARHCQYWYGRIKPEMQVPFSLEDCVEVTEVSIKGVVLKVASLPGVFSHGRLDEGTALLLHTMTHYCSGRVLDFGCGCGVVGAYVKHQKPDAALVLADSNALALYCSRATFALNSMQGEFVATDGWSDIKGRFHALLSNPPFHAGVATYYEATEKFLSDSSNHLIPGGSLTLVANAFLKYLPILERSFNQVKILSQNNKFRVYQALKRA